MNPAERSPSPLLLPVRMDVSKEDEEEEDDREECSEEEDEGFLRLVKLIISCCPAENWSWSLICVARTFLLRLFTYWLRL